MTAVMDQAGTTGVPAGQWSEPEPGSAFPLFPAGSTSPRELSAVLEALAVADLSDGDLFSALAGWQQVICAAQAAQAAVLQEMTARASVPDQWIADHVATQLVCTRRVADDLVARACLTGSRPVLQDAWAAGLLDARKVDVVVKEIAFLNQDAAAVEPAVLADAVAHAGVLTAPQLGQRVRRQVLAVDGRAAEARRVRAVADRCVTLTPGVDGMAWLTALLPAQVATAAFTVLDALAGTTHVDGDQRTADQRRADAFGDVFMSVLERQATPDGSPLPRRHGQAVTINVTVAASTLLGRDDAPGFLDSFGPIPAGLARDLAQDGTWRRVLTDPATGLVCEVGGVTYRPGADLTRTVIARDVTCTFPGCRQPAARCDLDHRVPFDPTRPAADQTCVENLHALCRHHHQAKTEKAWNVTFDKATGISTWTSWLGITTYNHPTPIHVDPSALEHHPPPARPPTTHDQPPPF